ncbi:LacI family DNA-binding transcriptional regulator [Anaeromicrobium sediminis]|uniref:LacI family transcriptional regulator n=1 Tax=Anaeromicrobium sediminis TaxID=1478221 RepID=A0A267MNK4_9FIRM|nr:LacI family DNA-binding transcriptional regulator [Anaeromicrobium sediminis]PAB60498.1 LacI family transcriptional regulator [Anaeromicrobium sediminis]
MNNRKVTIKDIAKYAKVSTATVSNVVNGKTGKISEETRIKVLKVIEKHNYIPNRIASSLVTKKTKTLGLIIPDISNPFFPEIARGAEDKANKAGYNVIVCNTDNSVKKEEEYLSMLKEKMIEGIIMTASENKEDNTDFYKKISLPIVLVDRDLNIDNVRGRILVDNFMGAYKGVSHMINRGYKKIVMISSSTKDNTSSRRIAGYEKALEDHKIDFKVVLEGVYSLEWGKEAIKKIIDSNIEFDGVFCGNDLIAIGAMDVLKDNKMGIPKDVGILGFDDIYLGEITSPKLTTIKQPNYMMGYKAAEILIDSIERNEKYKEIILDTEIVIRESV